MMDFVIQHQDWIWVALLILPLVLSLTACAAQYRLHPGSLNPGDSAAYDVLLVAEAAIDQARIENEQHPLSTEAKDALNNLVRTYNIARDAWLTYRGAVETNVSSSQYFQQLADNLLELENAIEDIKRKGVKQ